MWTGGTLNESIAAATATRIQQVKLTGFWGGCDGLKPPPQESQYYFKRQTSVTVVKDNHSQMLAKVDKHF